MNSTILCGMRPWSKKKCLLTTIDELIVALKAFLIFILIGIEAQNEQVAHGDEQAG